MTAAAAGPVAGWLLDEDIGSIIRRRKRQSINSPKYYLELMMLYCITVYCINTVIFSCYVPTLVFGDMECTHIPYPQKGVQKPGLECLEE